MYSATASAPRDLSATIFSARQCLTSLQPVFTIVNMSLSIPRPVISSLSFDDTNNVIGDAQRSKSVAGEMQCTFQMTRCSDGMQHENSD